MQVAMHLLRKYNVQEMVNSTFSFTYDLYDWDHDYYRLKSLQEKFTSDKDYSYATHEDVAAAVRLMQRYWVNDYALDEDQSDWRLIMDLYNECSECDELPVYFDE